MRRSLVALALVFAFVLAGGALLNRGGREPEPSSTNQRGGAHTGVLGAAAPSEFKAPVGSDTRPAIAGAETASESGASAEGESTAAIAPDAAPAVVPGAGDASDAPAEPGTIPLAPVDQADAVSAAGELGPAGDGSPGFDVLRVEPIGKALIAGRSRPGTEIEVLMDGQVVAHARADQEGAFIAILDATVPPGSHGLALREAGAAGSGGPERQVTVAARLGTDGIPPGVKQKIAAAEPGDAPGQVAPDFQKVAPAQSGKITDRQGDVQLGPVEGPDATPRNAGSDLVVGAPAAADGAERNPSHMAPWPGRSPQPEGAATSDSGTPLKAEVAGGATPVDGSATPGSYAEGGRAAVTSRPGAADGGGRVAGAAIPSPKKTAPGDGPAEMDRQRADDLARGNAPEQDVAVLESPPGVLTGQPDEGAPPPDAAALPGSSAEPAVGVRPPFDDRQQQARRSGTDPSSGRVVATPEIVVKPELPEGFADLQYAPVLRRLDAAPVNPQDAVTAGQAGTAATREGAGERPPLDGTELGRVAAVRTGPAALDPAAHAAPAAGFTSDQPPLPAGDNAGQAGADPGPLTPELRGAAGRDTARPEVESGLFAAEAPMRGLGDIAGQARSPAGADRSGAGADVVGLPRHSPEAPGADPGRRLPPGAKGFGDTGQDAALTAELPPPAVVIIRHGDNLWRISRRNYGRGIRYKSIFAANRDQIRNPDLIYPGQVFLVPTRDQSWTGARNGSGSPEPQ